MGTKQVGAAIQEDLMKIRSVLFLGRQAKEGGQLLGSEQVIYDLHLNRCNDRLRDTRCLVLRQLQERKH